MAKNMTVLETKEWVIRIINANKLLDVEYFEIVNSTTLKPIANWDEHDEKYGCIAVHVGSVRLIDNIRFNS